jgi:branched-chain amino acid transport system permease protein
MEDVIQAITNGVATGSIYALTALAFVIIFKATDVVNFAQGDMMMISAFISFSLFKVMPTWAAVILTMLISAGYGYGLERGVIRPIMDSPVFTIVIATLGVSSVLQGAAGLIWTFDVVVYPPLFSLEAFKIGNIAFTPLSLWIIAITMMIVAALTLYFKYTKLGTAMRAVAQNRTAASLMGIGVKNVFSLTFVISTVIGAAAGILAAPILYLWPAMGWVLIKSFAAAILGGFGSIPGAIVGGMLLGAMENLAVLYLPAQFKHIFAYIILLAVLVVKPSGIFGVMIKKV